MREKISLGIAEDEHMVRKGFEAILSEVPHFEVVLSAANGSDLLNTLEKLDELPSIVLLDLNMPETNGVDVMKTLPKKYPDIKVIALTSYDSSSFILSMIKLGAAAYVLKNEDPDSLISAIEAVAEKGFFYDRKVLEVLRENAIHPSRSRDIYFENIHFSERELEVLKLICEQYTTAEIGDKLFISPRTVEGHRNNLLQKAGVKNVVGLVIYAIQNEIVEMPRTPF